MRRRLLTAVALTLGLVAGACSGGGGEDENADLSLDQRETVLQFDAADKVRLGGTLAMPQQAGRVSLAASRP